MGIRFSPGGANWSYLGFHNFRTRLAGEAGIKLDQMDGFASGEPFVSWNTIDDDIRPLLNHSDCEGELTPEGCAKVAPRLRELVSNWPDDDYDKINALRLAEGMDEAVKSGENLEFS